MLLKNWPSSPIHLAKIHGDALLEALNSVNTTLHSCIYGTFVELLVSQCQEGKLGNLFTDMRGKHCQNDVLQMGEIASHIATWCCNAKLHNICPNNVSEAEPPLISHNKFQEHSSQNKYCKPVEIWSGADPGGHRVR